MKVSVPSTPSPLTTKYNNLMGVDFSVDASQVNKHRTPDGRNLIPDSAGNPEKRKGWSVLMDTTHPIDNLWSFEYEGVRYNLMSYGTTLVEFTDEELTPYTLISAGKKIGVYSQSPAMSGLFVFDDTKIIRCYPSAGEIVYQEITYYSPLVVIARDPVNGGGAAYENINMLTRKRRERFINSGTTVGSSWTADSGTNTLTSSTSHGLSVNDRVKFQVGTGILPTGIDPIVTYYVKTATSTEITIAITSGGSEINITADGTTGWNTLAASKHFLCTATVSGTPTIKYKDSSGTWQTATLDTVSGATVYVTNRYLGTTEDNIEIEYTASGSTTADQICECRAWARYNQSIVDRIFVTSSDLAGYGQYVYYSQFGDISYWPDQNYLYIGGSGTKIAGFLNAQDSIAVIKENTNIEPTIHYLYETTLDITNQDGSITTLNTYGARQTSAGIGAVSSCMGVLIDDPIFLSPSGIYGIATKTYTSEKIIRNRSVFINSKLMNENLSNAVSCVNGDKFMVFVGDHVYILDAKQRSNDSTTGSFIYECYYWDNVPAVSVMCYEGQIYFGGLVGSQNCLCKFNTSEGSSSYNDNGEAITSTWATPYDPDNGVEYYKVMQKKGSMLTAKPYSSSSVKIYCMADGGDRELIGSEAVSKGSFASFSFAHWSFRGSSQPKDIFFNKKKKKYKRLQIIVENAELNQAFGLVEIVKTWYPTRYARS